MIGPIAGLALILTWIFSAFVLTTGIYITDKATGRKEDIYFWNPFPRAIFATALLTILDWSLGFFFFPFLASISKIIIWFLVIIKFFKLNFIESLLLSVVLFAVKLLFMTFLVSSVLSIIAPLLL